jgi:hypothetical protein
METRMSYEDELVTRLSSSTNFGPALEIADAIEKVKVRLQQQFWRAAYDSLKTRVQSDQLIARWRLQVVLDPFNEPRRNESGLRYVLSRPTGESPRIEVILEVASSGLETCVGFIERPDKVPPEVDDLSNRLRQDQYVLPWRPEEKKRWIAWRDLRINLNDRVFLTSVASDPALAASGPIEALVSLLHKHGQAIEGADKALASTIGGTGTDTAAQS